MNKKTLLHRVSFAVLTVLCFAAHAQTTPTQNNFTAEEKAAKAQYAGAVRACASKLAPAQCQRQASLDYKQAQHAIKLRRDAADVANKQAKHDKSQADKARNAATAKQGVDAAGKPLVRAPLTKPHPPKNSVTQPLSKQQPAKSNTRPKPPMAKKETPKPKPTPSAPKKPLTAQPTPDQRRANVATFAKKEAEIATRKTQAQNKQAQRAAKDAQRRAAGFVVDKP